MRYYQLHKHHHQHQKHQKHHQKHHQQHQLHDPSHLAAASEADETAPVAYLTPMPMVSIS